MKFFSIPRKILPLVIVSLLAVLQIGFGVINPPVPWQLGGGSLNAAPCNYTIFQSGGSTYDRALNGTIVGVNTDPTGVINYALSAGGTTCITGPGIYATTGSLSSTVSGDRITMDKSATIKPVSGTFDVISLTGNDLEVDHTSIDTSLMTGGWSIRIGALGSSTRCSIHENNLQVGSTAGGVRLDSNAGVCSIYHNRIQSILAPTGAGILLAASADNHVVFNDIGGFGSGSGISCSQCGENEFSLNQIYSSLIGIDLYLAREIRVVGNHIGFMRDRGIRISADLTGTWGGDTIDANVIDGNGGYTGQTDGIILSCTGTCTAIKYITITNNVLTIDKVGGGTVIQVTGINFLSGNIYNVTISGNTFWARTPIKYNASCCDKTIVISPGQSGLNPIGTITNFIYNGNIAPWGISSTIPSSPANMIVEGVNAWVTATSGVSTCTLRLFNSSGSAVSSNVDCTGTNFAIFFVPQGFSVILTYTGGTPLVAAAFT